MNYLKVAEEFTYEPLVNEEFNPKVIIIAVSHYMTADELVEEAGLITKLLSDGGVLSDECLISDKQYTVSEVKQAYGFPLYNYLPDLPVIGLEDQELISECIAYNDMITLLQHYANKGLINLKEMIRGINNLEQIIMNLTSDRNRAIVANAVRLLDNGLVDNIVLSIAEGHVSSSDGCGVDQLLSERGVPVLPITKEYKLRP